MTRRATFVGRGRIADGSIKATTFAKGSAPIIKHEFIAAKLCGGMRPYSLRVKNLHRRLSLLSTMATVATATRKVMLDTHRKAPTTLRSARR